MPGIVGRGRRYPGTRTVMRYKPPMSLKASSMVWESVTISVLVSADPLVSAVSCALYQSPACCLVMRSASKRNCLVGGLHVG